MYTYILVIPGEDPPTYFGYANDVTDDALDGVLEAAKNDGRDIGGIEEVLVLTGFPGTVPMDHTGAVERILAEEAT